MHESRALSFTSLKADPYQDINLGLVWSVTLRFIFVFFLIWLDLYQCLIRAILSRKCSIYDTKWSSKQSNRWFLGIVHTRSWFFMGVGDHNHTFAFTHFWFQFITLKKIYISLTIVYIIRDQPHPKNGRR